MPRRIPPHRRPASQRKPPDGRMRQSQMISTYGAGSLIDLVDDAVIVGGLDFWRMPGGGEPVHEPRLRDAVYALFAQSNRPLSVDRPFRKPPKGEEQEASENVGVQVYEFPRWFVCQNPRCRALTKAGSGLDRKGGHYVHQCGAGTDRPERCVPIRFLAACRAGHVDDINWVYWSHQQNPCDAARLRLDEGASGDFSEVAVTCASCGAYRRLIDLTVEEKAHTCSGERPWLGREGKEACQERQRLLVRTASNSYFPQVMSALSIPEPDSLRRRVQSQWKVLQAATPQTIAAFRQIPDVQAAIAGDSDEAVLKAVADEHAHKEEEVPEIRTAEFSQFVKAPREKPGELPAPDDQFWARGTELPGRLPDGFSRVVIARKLREVAAQIGFTRLEPASKDLQGRVEDLGVQTAPLALLEDWLPAIEIRGEGLFLQLDEGHVAAWEKTQGVIARGEKLLAGFQLWKQRTKSRMKFPGVRFYLLHSLAHQLITTISLDCGYPASAISERIYCAPATDETPMAAILLSTGTTGTEGTLGGLVEEGRRLRQHLRKAFDDARLCSNDPVCAQHQPASPDDRNLEGAACHGCLFIPECSCERFNQFLDRALVFPTLGSEEAAFFKTAP